MASEHEISSTERLLNLVRGNDADTSDSLGGKPKPRVWDKLRLGNLSFLGSKSYIGVEFFRDNLNLVHIVRSQSRFHLVRTLSIPLRQEMDLENPEFANILQGQLQKMDPGGKARIWASLPATAGEIWSCKVPKVRKGLTNVVYWSARKEKSFDPSEYMFDYRIKAPETEGGVTKLGAEVCIASRREVNRYQKVFADIGYPLTGLTLPAFGLENLIHNGWADPGVETYAILYIGETYSYIVIYSQGMILLSRVIRTGWDSILDALSMEYSRQAPGNAKHDSTGSDMVLKESPSMTREQAADLLARIPVTEDAGEFQGEQQPSWEQILNMVHPALERLARQLERTIDHSVNMLSNPAPEFIYIAGAISYLPGLPEFFTEELGISTDLLDVLQYPGKKDSGISGSAHLAKRMYLVSAAGLAMPSHQTINFLHTAMDRDQEKNAMRNANIVAASCALAFVLVAGYWYYSLQELEEVKTSKKQLEQELSEYDPRLEMDMLTRMAEEHKQGMRDVRKYARRLQVVAVLSELTRITPEYIHVQELRLEPAEGEGLPEEAGLSLAVDGFIRGDPGDFRSRITSYFSQLRDSPFFVSSQLQSREIHEIPDGEEIYRFVINIELKQV